MSIWAVIVAAGSGQRLGSTIPKVLYPLAGKELIDWTLVPFGESGRVDGICIVTTKKLIPWMERKLKNIGKPFVVVSGGKDRGASVKAGLKALPGDCEWVMIHDGDRPCLRHEDLEKLIDHMLAGDNAVAGYPARDTLHLVDEKGDVVDTPDRRSLWAVQTPQCFSMDKLMKAYRNYRE